MNDFVKSAYSKNSTLDNPYDAASLGPVHPFGDFINYGCVQKRLLEPVSSPVSQLRALTQYPGIRRPIRKHESTEENSIKCRRLCPLNVRTYLSIKPTQLCELPFYKQTNLSASKSVPSPNQNRMKSCEQSTINDLSIINNLHRLKIICVGANPSDHMQIDAGGQQGDWVGTDFVGEVVELGSAVPRDQVEIGQLRWNYCRGGFGEKGAFAE